jgi:hypothetical protein
MGLFGRLFGSKGSEGEGGASTQFRESDSDYPDPGEGSRNGPRRELVQVVLRDTMRKHGIPSDWIDCRILSTVSKAGRHGLHASFIVKQAHDRMIGYVFAFQDSFERELARFEPRARDWLLSIGWEFQGFNAADMPQPRTFTNSVPAPPPARAGQVQAAGDLPPLDLPGAKVPDSEPPKNDEDVQRDLAALFAIRDAALAQAAGRKPPEGDDFQPTQPFADPGDGSRK